MPIPMNLVCLAFIPVTRPYGLYDPLCISGETFLGLGRGLICRCSGVFVGQLWMNPGSKLPNVKKDVQAWIKIPNIETELKFFTLKNKIFGIMESLLYQNLYKTKNSPYLTNLKYTWDFSRKKND
jgi:hypothetical protein